MGGLGPVALPQALQIQRQPGGPVLQRQDRRKGRARLHQAEQLPPAVDPHPGPEGQPGVDLLGLGQLRHQRLQQILGDQPQRHSGHADQLLDQLLEELGRHPLLALGEHGRVAELAELDHLGHPAYGSVQRGARLSLQAQGSDGQGPLVRENLAAIHRQDDQHALDHRIGALHSRIDRQNAQRHRAHPARLSLVQPLQLHQHLAAVQLHREVVFQEAGAAVEPPNEPGRLPRPAVRLLASVQLQRQRLGLDHPLRHVPRQEQTPAAEAAGRAPYADPHGRILLRAGLHQVRLRIL